jgi:hypothetical protein
MTPCYLSKSLSAYSAYLAVYGLSFEVEVHREIRERRGKNRRANKKLNPSPEYRLESFSGAT